MTSYPPSVVLLSRVWSCVSYLQLVYEATPFHRPFHDHHCIHVIHQLLPCVTHLIMATMP